MNTRRGFLALLGGALATAAIDPERLLWTPGAKLISIPNGVVSANPPLTLEGLRAAIEVMEREFWRLTPREFAMQRKVFKLPHDAFGAVSFKQAFASRVAAWNPAIDLSRLSS